MINKDSTDYIKTLNEFFFLPGSIAAICRLCRAGFDIFIITNQSGIGRKLIAPSDLTAMHQYLIQRVSAAGGCIKDIFFCPHRPEENCFCRKPQPGMLLNAQKKHAINLSAAVMVGDRTTDIECAQNAGVGRSILIQTTDSRAALNILRQKGTQPDQVFTDLFNAASWIIDNGC